MGVIAEEAYDAYDRQIVHVLANSVYDDSEENVERLTDWIAQFRNERTRINSVRS